jgi:hypothetical protein
MPANIKKYIFHVQELFIFGAYHNDTKFDNIRRYSFHFFWILCFLSFIISSNKIRYTHTFGGSFDRVMKIVGASLVVNRKRERERKRG